jgi:hypothetical protein
MVHIVNTRFSKGKLNKGELTNIQSVFHGYMSYLVNLEVILLLLSFKQTHIPDERNLFKSPRDKYRYLAAVDKLRKVCNKLSANDGRNLWKKVER